MKLQQLSSLIAASLIPVGHAQITIPSNGSDGPFSPVTDIEVDLTRAIPGTWSDDNTGANIGKGIYDKDQWAVVFEYSSVTIPEGVTVSFKNHPSNPPVIWLVSGEVTIDGVLSLEGESEFDSGLEALNPNNGGPGGFRGGPSGPEGRGRGLGPGGARTNGGDGVPVYRNGVFSYGNPQIVPLIGGSGGWGQPTGASVAGSGGGGGLLIATPQNINLGGTIDCSGGDTHVNWSELRGSGGAIRLVANNVTGDGVLDCRGGFWARSGFEDEVYGEGGSLGRIRIETLDFSSEITMFPETVAVLPAVPVLLFPPANAPSVAIVSIDGIAVSDDPRASLQATSDVAIQNNGPVKIVLETKNFPLEGVVQLRVGRKFGEAFWVTATLIDGTINSATWEVEETLTDGFSALQARATAP